MLAFNKAENRPDYMRVDLMREWLVDLGGAEEEEEEEKHLKVGTTKESAWGEGPWN